MVTYCVTKNITCSPMIGQFFDAMIVASSDKEWLQSGFQLSVVKPKPNPLLTNQTTQPTSNQNQNQSNCLIDQFRYIKIQAKTIDFSTRLWGITTEFVGFIPQSLVLRSIVLGRILIYRNWSITFDIHMKTALMTHQNLTAGNRFEPP